MSWIIGACLKEDGNLVYEMKEPDLLWRYWE